MCSCDGPFFKDKKVAVIGGGDAAMKEALYLSKITKEVTIIHRRDQLRAQEALQKMVKEKPNIKFAFNCEIMEILGEEKVTGVKLKNNQSGEISTETLDGVFIAVGYQPATEFLKGKIDLDETGHIVIHEETKTSVDGVFACGDVMDSKYRQIVTAAGAGAKAALDVEHFLDNL